ARLHLLAYDGFARRHDREGPGGGDAERRHGLAHDVLPEHGAERRASVSTARERSAPCTLQLEIAALAVLPDDLAEQDGAAVTELGHEVSELMAGVSERDRRRAFGQRVAGEQLCALGRCEDLGIEA